MTKKKINTFPEGWNEKRTKRLLAHYEGQSEQAATSEDTAAFKKKRQTVMGVPNELAPLIGRLIAKHNGGSSTRNPI
jgi:hypothetical protein